MLKDTVKLDDTPTVLLVEDSDDDAFFFELALKKCGMAADLKVVGDGRAAVEFLSNEENRRHVCLIFLDLKLPLLNGFDVLAWIGEQSFRLESPIYVLSGSSEAMDRQKALALGAAGYFEKPMTATVLRRHFPCPAIA
jgi:DNA-binding response OmpR family regulator